MPVLVQPIQHAAVNLSAAMSGVVGYSLIGLPSGNFVDNHLSTPLLYFPLNLRDGRVWEASILGVSNTIHAIRMKIPDVEGDLPSGDDIDRFRKFRRFLLDCIKLNYDPVAEYLRQGDAIVEFYTRLNDDGRFDVNLKIDEPINPDYRINIEGLKALIQIPIELRAVLRLLTDSFDSRLPMQFRFLSMYKILEMHYVITSNKKFSAFITTFIPEIQRFYPVVSNVQDVCRQLSLLRNRCAHIKLSSGELGFSHPQATQHELFVFMPCMISMSVQCIRNQYPDSPLRFSASACDAEQDIAAMVAKGENPIRAA